MNIICEHGEGLPITEGRGEHEKWYLWCLICDKKVRVEKPRRKKKSRS